jgi:nicotinamide phosphoribosyltransferase
MNLLLMTDSYKAGHARLYPENLTELYSYVESRGGRFPFTVFFGLQYYVERYLARGISETDVDEAEAFWSAHFGRSDYFPAETWRELVRAHEGRIPLRIRAVPEGSVVPTHNVLVTIESTDSRFPFVTTFFETLLLKLWYPTTIATQSFAIRQDIARVYRRTGADLAGLDFACHDFGYRGVSSEETAGLGGAAHLLSFQGTDTVAGIRMLAEHYDGGMSAFSIPATEHSVITAFPSEAAAFAHLLGEFPGGTVACVSDTYNVFDAVAELWGEEFRHQVLAREGRLVIRPDSGDPFSVVPRVLELLGQRFPVTTNTLGYRTLDPHIRVIQGDGMNLETIGKLYETIADHGWAADNLVVGSGGGLLQQVNRDTLAFALKASHAEYADGTSRSISKNPVTDRSKRSKPGRLKLVRSANGWETVSDATLTPEMFAAAPDVLETVFENGAVLRRERLEDVRARVRSATDDVEQPAWTTC